MSQFKSCCSAGCDKIQGLEEHRRIVEAFDQLYEWQSQHGAGHRLWEGLEKLNAAIACLRETQ